MAFSQTLAFVKQFLTKPGSTGAIIPSSNALARKMLAYAAPKADAVIAEYGPGTGVFTEVILNTLLPEQRFFAIEINEDFARALRERWPELHLHEGCASGVAECCAREGLDHVDTVISGLPWAIFPNELQTKILSAMVGVMPAGGVFVTFAYLQGLVMPSGLKFKENLKKYFSKVEISGVVWRNFPPAIMYRCTK